MKKYMYPLGAACLLALMCLYPDDALAAAVQSLSAWAHSVVPSLLPYLIVCPALTSEEMTAFLSRFLNGLTRAMRLPATSCGTVLIGLLSGSPAGAAALASSVRDESAPPGAVLRAALLASGASPAFLLTGVAVSMLDRPETGWILLRSQLLSVLICGLLLRSFGTDKPAAAPSHRRSADGPVLRACLTLLTIGGYMVLFSVLSRLLSQLFGCAWETPLLAVMELAGGCRALSLLPVPMEYCLPVISAAACFGGISVYAQCMSFLRPLGVDPSEYAVGKLVQSALCALMTYIQLEFSAKTIDPALTGFLILCCLLVILMAHTTRSRHASGSRIDTPSGRHV